MIYPQFKSIRLPVPYDYELGIEKATILPANILTQ
jgi:hypothetical protein